jgi:hypothetical protein
MSEMPSPETSAGGGQPVPNFGQAAIDIATAWDMNTITAMRRGSEIIALRGAGSTGGIDPSAADHVLDDLLIPQIEQVRRQEKPVVVMYDGDPDDPARPDIGYVAGRLLDRFGRFVDTGDMTFMTAQADDWYYPPRPGSNLANASGRPFDTYVFPRGVYPGDHNRFTQSDILAAYPRYRQVYIGAAGMLAAQQMVDYCNRVPGGGNVNITLIRALINGALDREIGEQLATAVDDAKRQKLESMLEQRRRQYGVHWGDDGRFDASFLEEVRRPDDAHELVVLWSTPEAVDVVNCRRIDLNTPEYDRLFEEAPYYIKTTPIRARQVPAGHTEIVPVKSGATTDTAREGEWVCTSVAGEDYKGPSDFLDVYEPDPDNPGLFKPRWDPRKMIKLTEDVIFMAPWGEPQAVAKGGYLMERVIKSGPQAGKTERYGIAQKDAEPDMILVN